MSTMQKLMADLFNGFSPSDIPLLLVQLFSSALLAWLSSRILQRNGFRLVLYQLVLTAIIVALLVAVVKNSIPLSVCLAAVAVLASGRFSAEKDSPVPLLLALTAGLGCGSGYVALTWIGFVIVVLPVLWFYKQ